MQLHIFGNGILIGRATIEGGVVNAVMLRRPEVAAQNTMDGLLASFQSLLTVVDEQSDPANNNWVVLLENVNASIDLFAQPVGASDAVVTFSVNGETPQPGGNVT